MERPIVSMATTKTVHKCHFYFSVELMPQV